ncbi:hypothetical protein [Phytohabitans rumicis]|uniref:Uncharacterized protein n=1 Tax=Phytohabitans rumicis TaxID=1076125 RepID=A0A6V8LLQ6_9ACTN|nr:hypothetical protein [Phytohabitans rumicis]GFJ96480.1 hypothetical protein Prum_101220 [Phytohabitans rumicis]
MDVGLTAKVTGAARIETSQDLQCALGLSKFFKTLTASPVPISVSFDAAAQFTIGGGLKIENVGLTATGGVRFAGSMTVKNGPSFTGHTIMEAAPLTPKVTKNGSVGFKVGGELILGPGVGSTGAGVIAGISGELSPLDASLKPYHSEQDSQFNNCTIAAAAFTRSLGLVVKAWLSKWSFSQKISSDALTGSTPYGGSPWSLPKDCDKNTPSRQTRSSVPGCRRSRTRRSVAQTSGATWTASCRARRPGC